jgi:hypothetical protein
MAYEAIQLFGDAFERVQDPPPGGPVEVDDVDDGDSEAETGDPERLSVAIERAYAYWRRLHDTVTRLGKEGFTVTRVMEAIEDVEDHLFNASMYQEEGNHTAAVGEFREARKSLGRVHGFIESKVKERKEEQTEQFLGQFERRVEKITGVLDGLQESLEAGKIQRVRGVLRSTAQRLLRLSDSLAGGDLEGVLDDMEDAVEALEDGIDELNGEGLSKQIKSHNRFEAKIESLNKTLQRFANTGFETSELDEYLADAQVVLAGLEAAVREGDEEAAEGFIEEAEELIKEIRDHFKELRKESIKLSQGVENGLGRPDSPGRSDDDDDEEDDDENGNNVAASSESLGSNNITEELEELAIVISRIENRLENLSTNVNATDVEHLIEDAEALMEEARALAEENSDEAEDLIGAAEELVEEALDLIEKMTESHNDNGVETLEPEDDDDDDDNEDDENDEEPETTV